MNNYVMSQIQLKYGFANQARYQAAMVTVQEYFESQGEKLVLSTTTRVGTLFEVITIWEVEDQGHHQRVLANAPLGDPKVQRALAELSAVVDHEQIRLLESLPLVDANHRGVPTSLSTVRGPVVSVPQPALRWRRPWRWCWRRQWTALPTRRRPAAR